MNRDNLHPYQQRGVQFIKDKEHCACFIDLGMGKTITTLTAFTDLWDDAEVESCLVIAPKKVAEATWATEAAKWEHTKHLRVVKVMGTEKQRIAALDTDADIYVIGRDSFVWLVKYYNGKMPFDMCVIDELTSFKSTNSLRFKAFRLVRSQFERIVGLTGTPAPNGYEDLFGQLYCIDGGQRLGKYVTHFRNKYMNIVMAHGQHFPVRKELKPGAKEQIDQAISDISLTMLAEDYLTLPDRQVIEQYVELPKRVMKDYHAFKHEQILALNDEEITATSAAALMNKLLQYCNGAVYNEDRDVLDVHDEKITALCELVESAQSPVLVFYQFIHDKERIAKALKSYKLRIYESEKDLEDWNAGKLDVLLAHPASCAYGLNLQHGGHIICWFGLTWNLELYEQANARLYRQGQQHPVQIYHLITRGTVESAVLRALTNKAATQADLLNTIKELI